MDLNLWLLVAILFLVFLSLFTRPSGESPRLRAIDRKLDLLLAQMNINPHEGLDAELRELAASGRKIEAIRLYRERTGAGLKEAKDYIESHF